MPENTNKDKLSNYSLEFNGTNEYINFPQTNFLNNGQASFSFWIKPKTWPGGSNYGYFLSGNSTGGLAYSEGSSAGPYYPGVLYWYNGSTSYLFNVTLSQNVWSHIVIVFDGTSVRTYKDGDLGTTTTIVQPSALTFDTIGRYSVHYINGFLSEFSIFDYAVSQEQVTYLYNLNNPMAITGAKPVAYWPLGDNSNPTALTGYPNLSVGGSVFDFTPDDYIDLGTRPFSFTQNLTVSFWLKTSQTATNSLIGKDNNNITSGRNWIAFTDSGLVKFWTTSSGSISTISKIVSNTSVNDNQWHHIVCVNDYVNSTKQIYIDGSLDITDNNGAAISTSSAPVRIGIRDTAPDDFPYDGLMSNVALWDTALNSTQVTTLYNNGAPGDISSLNPTAWYKLDSSEIFNSTSTEWSVDNNAYPSVYKSSLNFDGNDFINCGNNSSLSLDRTDSFSLSAWINSSSSLFNGSIFSKFDNATSTGYFMGMNSARNNLRFAFRKGIGGGSSQYNYVETNDAINTNQWSHVLATYNGNQDASGIVLYVNGVAVNTTIISNTLQSGSVSNNEPFRIGSNSGATFFDGQISNAAVFNSVLTGSQVATIYNNGTPETSISHSPFSWWKLDNTTTGIQDSAGSNNGTNNGATKYAGFVNSLAGESSGMTSANLVKSNLYRTTPYSNYSINFDSPSGDYFNFNNASSNIMANKNTISISAWFKLDSNTTSAVVSNWYGGGLSQYLIRYNIGANLGIQWYVKIGSTSHRIDTNYYPSVGDWVHVVGVKDPITNGGQIRVYINTVEYSLNNSNISNPIFSNNSSDQIGVFNNTADFMDGSISNVAYWTNTALTQGEVTEIYNGGVTTNLSNFSGTAPDHWCTLDGKKVYYNGSVIVARDAIGTLQATGVNLAQENIVGNAPGSNLNGTGSNLDILDLQGNMSNSTKNAKSINMADYGDPNAQGVTPADSGRTTSVPG